MNVSEPIIMDESVPAKGSPTVKWLLIGVIVVAAIAAAFVFDVKAQFGRFLSAVESLGTWGPIAFVAVYVLATVFMVPGSILTLGAGALFGVVQGSVLVSIASTAGATLAFLIGRHLARAWVQGKIEGNSTFKAIDDAVGLEGWKIVGLTRLSPIFPFSLLNYAFGLTKVKLGHYVLASWIGMMPGTVMYVYIGSLAKATSEGRSVGQWILTGVGLAATVLVTVVITRAAKKALAARIEEES